MDLGTKGYWLLYYMIAWAELKGHAPHPPQDTHTFSGVNVFHKCFGYFGIPFQIHLDPLLDHISIGKGKGNSQIEEHSN